QRLAPLLRNDRQRIERRTILSRKERMRPGLSAKPPADNPADGAQEQREIKSGRTGRRLTHCVLAEDRAHRFAEDIIRPWCIKGLHGNADKGNGRAERVADWRVAARRVPTVEPLGRQAKSRDPVLPPGEAERSRRHLNDVAAALVIEEVDAAELMRIG